MVSIKYEIYKNDYNRRYEDKSFRNMGEFKDWMFGLMNRPYVDADGYKNMYFLDDAIRVGRNIRTGDEIRFKPEFRGANYWIHCVSDNNKIVFSNGKYTNGQCYISEGFKAFMQECMDKRDGKEQSFAFGEIEGYVPAVPKSVADYMDQAADILEQNPDLARAVYLTVQRQYDREDIGKHIKRYFPETQFTDADISEITERFNEHLGEEDDYWVVYWDVADAVIAEFVKEKDMWVDPKNLFVVAKEVCDEIVDTALRTIQGVGVDQGSGCYELNSFVIEGENLNLYADICMLKDEATQGLYYAVYYAVEYENGDNLFSDWKHTERLDSEDLKKVVCEIANTDFSEDIKKALPSLEKQIKGAENVGVKADLRAKSLADARLPRETLAGRELSAAIGGCSLASDLRAKPAEWRENEHCVKGEGR